MTGKERREQERLRQEKSGMGQLRSIVGGGKKTLGAEEKLVNQLNAAGSKRMELTFTIDQKVKELESLRTQLHHFEGYINAMNDARTLLFGNAQAPLPEPDERPPETPEAPEPTDEPRPKST